MQLQDKLIVSTAIPQITNDFNSAADIGWYGTAYLLTNAAFQLLFGKLYKFMPIKTTFMASVALFEGGSVLCGAAPNSMAFIIGRALSGIGAGGIMSGVVCSLPSQRDLSLFDMHTKYSQDGCPGLLRTARGSSQDAGHGRRLVRHLFGPWTYTRRSNHE
jgi:hypothetical protein